MVFVPSILFPTPWARRPNSLANERSQIFTVRANDEVAKLLEIASNWMCDRISLVVANICCCKCIFLSHYGGLVAAFVPKGVPMLIRWDDVLADCGFLFLAEFISTAAFMLL